MTMESPIDVCVEIPYHTPEILLQSLVRWVYTTLQVYIVIIMKIIFES